MSKEANGHLEEHEEAEELPTVLLLGQAPPTILPFFQHGLLQKYKFLNPSQYPNITIHQFLTTHRAQAQHVRALLTLDHPRSPIDSKLLNCLPCLECVVSTSVAVNFIDLVECNRRRIAVCNAGTVYSEDVADYAVGLLLDVLIGVTASNRYVRSGFWPLKGAYVLGHKLGAKRVGIVGLGNIGLEVAKRLEAFGCSIAYNSRKKKTSVEFPYHPNVYRLATNCDVLILCCPLTDETRHIVNKDVLSALGKEGIIINIGRGAVIDEKELVQYLMEGKLGGAGLDVFENEPDVPKELFEMDNVVLSPHCAVLTPDSLMAMEKLASANLEAFFSDKPLVSRIDYE